MSKNIADSRFKIAIVFNWAQDEAYISITLNLAVLNGNAIKVAWQDPVLNEHGLEEFALGNKDAQFKLASTIYGHVLKRHNMRLLQNSKSFPLLVKSKEREAFRITMYDFYNLVEIL